MAPSLNTTSDNPLRDLCWASYNLFVSQPFLDFLRTPHHTPHTAFPLQLEDIRNAASQITLDHLVNYTLLSNVLKKDNNDSASSGVLYLGVVDGDANAMLSLDKSGRSTIKGNIRPDPADLMTVAAFFLQPGARLPLHDHPKMLGILTMVHGEMMSQSYSSVASLPPASRNSSTRVLVRKSPPKRLKAKGPGGIEPVVLFSQQEDIHEMWNDSDDVAVFLDVLAPPYTFRRANETESPFDDRHITYYKEKALASGAMLASQGLPADSRDHVVLEEIPVPDWYNCTHIPYTGPQLERVQ